ncbi:MAG: LysM peptidoglycan-binding domain-containing protein [Rickettsiales bacterium]|jgi:nucleoid-associated protein YgaU|nr:LysM peptidoglycan-binding domain-containing protein [Rickettsiales bacterium]
MDKKEPMLIAGNSDAQENRATFSAGNRMLDRKAEKTERKRPAASALSKKKIAIAALIFLAVAGAVVWIISAFRTEPNVAEAPQEVAAAAPPSFDIVRMEKGEVVASGRAKAGEEVHILDNGREIGIEKADANGQWVFLPKKSLAPGNRRLSLFAIRDGAKVKSKQSALLHVSKTGKDDVAAIMGGKKSTVIAAPRGQDIGALRIAKLDYTESGEFHAEGVALSGRKVRLFLDNELVGEASSGKAWTIDADRKMEARPHALRADMMTADGKKVARRVEYKFTPTFFDDKNTMVMIKKGDCLWNLALREYGRGANYVVIFEANKSQIRDPDLIYVKQTFVIPKKDGEFFKANAAKPLPATKKPRAAGSEAKKPAPKPAAPTKPATATKRPAAKPADAKNGAGPQVERIDHIKKKPAPAAPVKTKK